LVRVDTIEFRRVTESLPLEAGGVHRGQRIQVFISGEDLASFVRPIERAFAGELAGNYYPGLMTTSFEDPVAKHFRGSPNSHLGEDVVGKRR
jgi:hypothetical protein